MTSSPQPWFRKRRNQLLVVVLILVIAVAAYDVSNTNLPKSPNEVALTRTVTYFVHAYNFTIGLVAETPGGHTYWLYSDNYLASLALQRYDPSNQSTANFALAISEATGSYAGTIPSGDLVSQYTALNSTTASFSCPQSYRVSWTSTQGNATQGTGSADVRTTSNNGDSSCAQQSYADILLLEAIHSHVGGDDAAAGALLQRAAGLFDGTGFADAAYTNSTSATKGVYQTYKLALYVVASSCLGKSSTDTTLTTAEGLLLRLQDNSTGGFYSGYVSPGNHGTSLVNTETTALGALALEAMINPSASC